MGISQNADSSSGVSNDTMLDQDDKTSDNDNLIIENRKKEVKVKNKRKIQKKKRLSFERERQESNESVDSLDQFLFEGDQMENRNFNEDYIKHQQINDHEKEDLRNDHNHSIERKKNIEKQNFFVSTMANS